MTSSRCCGAPRALLPAVVAAACLLGAPAAAPAAKGAISVPGSKAKTARLCGDKGRTYTVPSGRGITVTIKRASRSLKALRVATCRKNTWRSSRSVRLPKRRKPKRALRVKLPALAPGAYRLSAKGLRSIRIRVVRGSGSGGAGSTNGKTGGRTRERDGEQPLLDRSTVRAPFVAFCEGPNGKGPRRSDSTALPEDPRTLVNKHLDRKDAAIYFNGSWIPVHDAPGFRKTPFEYPKTCGEFRRDVAQGKEFLYGKQFFQLLASARAYDNLWRAWGLSEKPADFDEMVRERYGLPKAPFRNPYPKPGEDPKKGGSGQLPLGLVQGQDKTTGEYNGMVTITCAACHDSIMGTPENNLGWHPGRGSDAFDASLFGAEMASAAGRLGEPPPRGALATALVPYPYSAGRGLTNAFGLLDYLAVGFDMETLDQSPGVEFFPTHGAAGQVQTPNWWNRSHRPRMFLAGELSGDNTRVSMALAVPQDQRSGAEVKQLEPKFEQAHVFLDSLSPPPFPRKVDEELAEEGAILFHEKNLWGDSRNRAIPRQPGNGSCASCHGVYSPRYAHDTKFLPDPRLKGIEANIVPIETIDTDPARTRLVNEQFKRAWNTSWWGYDDLNPSWTKEGQGRPGTTFERLVNDYSAQNTRLEGPNRWSNVPLGYEAPPLYGVWASAPYFHNGSVPTVRGVLQPSKRPTIWQRTLTKPRNGAPQGLDPSLEAYDFADLGYKVREVPCDQEDVQTPVVACRPKGSALSTVEGEISKLLGPNLFIANQEAMPMDENDRQRRMIYNTREYSMGKGGHDFTKVLDEHEVKAILEYLKTL